MTAKTIRPSLIKTCKRTILVIFAFTMLFCSGCIKPVEEAMIGRWEYPSNKQNEFFEFFTDKTCLVGTGKGKQLSGHWFKVSENRIKGDFLTMGTSLTYIWIIKISGDKMIIAIEGNPETEANPVTYIRAK